MKTPSEFGFGLAPTSSDAPTDLVSPVLSEVGRPCGVSFELSVAGGAYGTPQADFSASGVIITSSPCGLHNSRLNRSAHVVIGRRPQLADRGSTRDTDRG